MASDNETLSTRYIEEQGGKLISSKDYEALMSYEAWKLAWIPEGRYGEFQWLISHGRDVTQAMDVLDDLGAVHDPVRKKAEWSECPCFGCVTGVDGGDRSLKYAITRFKKLLPINKQDDYEARVLKEDYLPALLEGKCIGQLPGGYKSPKDFYCAIMEERSEEEKEQDLEHQKNLHLAYLDDKEMAMVNWYLQELDRRAKRLQRIMTWFNVKDWALNSELYLELAKTLEKMQTYLGEASVLEETGRRSMGLWDFEDNIYKFDEAAWDLRQKWALEPHS
jgi:hypothetical protein